MDFNYRMPTRVFFGRQCISRNKDFFARLGRKAFIVTGKSSARASGALDDIEGVLNEANIKYEIYDGVENNPSLNNVEEAGALAAKSGADFIIGIGGGSPLDASKAVAVLAVNRMEAVELYKNSFPNRPLPIIAIPTTAGTGSEVTPYCILTRPDMQTKMSFGNDETFPAAAFLDASYTESLTRSVTVNTAIDALTHAMEGYLSKRSTAVTDALAAESMEILGECLIALNNGEISPGTRDKLLYASMLAGMVIANTGTTIIHGMGYSLTYFKDIPHGEANALFVKEYLEFNRDAAPEKTDRVLGLLKVESTQQLGGVIASLIEEKPSLNGEEINYYADLTMKQRSTLSNIKTVSAQDIEGIIRRSVKQL
ncbi:alcohol dehydrogenase class IV [Anaerobacterium chartisolvens]|uniref:Alcohol dehydrogenase class IV n=1 Tax=Anaerobacterium chartisolvens TaxID=1297424 RepID=A0A369API4_9FIRM|nr:iron-containing alcohol dehydrogenase family protein [Anaerobacterium chartisolvens]RCX11270.1 alcohol dehydrogenase class IV [Anaerobacterium chartisolvens]